MVLSQLNNTIHYPETHKVDKDDINHDTPLYQTDVDDVDIIIALGNVNFTFVKENVLFIPIYLTYNYKVVSKIGVYEFLNDKYSGLLDDDGDLALDRLDEPLLYDFVNKVYLRQFVGDASAANKDEEDDDEEDDDEEDDDEEDDDEEDDDEEDDDEEDDDEEDDDEEDDDDSVEQDLFGESGLGKSVLPEEGNVLDELLETATDAETDGEQTNWVQKFLKNTHYGIEDAGGGGDCLFEVIREASKNTTTPYTVAQLRHLLSTEANEELFKGYREMYDMHEEEIRKDIIGMRAIKQQIKSLKVLYQSETNQQKAKTYVTQAEKLRDDYERLKSEKGFAKEVIVHEFAFMKGIKTLEAFKKIITTCRFWGDTWAISTLERILNIKVILLSSRNYTQHDYKNVLQCGQMNDVQLEKKGVFNPKYYIITDYMGNHYKLVSYKQKNIFTFKDLPYGLAHQIVANCMVSKGGLYNLIPQFKRLKESLVGKGPSPGGAPPAKGKEDPTFNEDIVFQFYSRSQNKAPGTGAGEKIPAADKKRFEALKKNKGWRKVLSNFYIYPFEYDGHTWNSTEHLYHALKFKKKHPEFYTMFSLESKSPFSESPLMAKAAGGKTGIFTTRKKDAAGKMKTEKKILRTKDIVADSDFWDRKNEAMEKALRAKFTKEGLPRQILKDTLDAKLVHYLGRGHGTETWEHLMKIREEI